MNTDLIKKAKCDFEKDFFKLMNNAAFGKSMENVRKHRDIEPVATESRRNYLVPEPNYHTINFFAKHLSALEMKKAEILKNKPIYLGLSTLELSKDLMYEFWYDYVKPKYDGKAKLYYMDTGIFIVYIKTNDIYEDIAEELFKFWNFEIDERRIRQKNHDEICLVNSKILQLLNRWR